MSQTPGCWIITGGTNTGVMKHVGEALQGQSKTLIGIATWGIVSDKESLVQSKEIPLGGRFPYIVKSSLDQKGACLDHNHTHFLLIHDGSEGDFQSEIPFRSEFEKFIMENSSGGQEDCSNQTESDKSMFLYSFFNYLNVVVLFSQFTICKSNYQMFNKKDFKRQSLLRDRISSAKQRILIS